ncbi:MAG TPA: hypothetical protein VM913_08815 [Sphingomicrobium sp.]|nr:hypothetical protein [Sphingomicrobium sp.]
MDYQLVQDQIFGLIEAELDGAKVTRSVGTSREDAVNFGLHIRQSRKNNVPLPLDVLMSHGLADKSYLLAKGADGRRLVNNYQHVIVPGEWFKRRLRRWRWHPIPSKRVTIRPTQVHVGGWPRVDHFFDSQPELPPSGRPRLLWAPSHNNSSRQQSFSSYPAFEAYLDRLAEEFDVRVSLHPSNRTDKSPTQGDLDWAEVVISDFGTLLYEAWAAEKCVIIPRWLIPDAIEHGSLRFSAEGQVFAKRIGNHAKTFEELLDYARQGNKPDPGVQSFMKGILDPRYRGSSARRIAELLQTLPVPRLGN